ncbi:hypothetical protein [Pseudomonas zeae]|uniref:Uncharacterized protein n=1 Tax=Pseudomonas zeae TaxID=2745510 RepID=A0ABU5BPD5_9PSED|nr:hypothetical protein [Pseudomonas zeae]MDX9678534.1 hypothetical protein [Pseudomonas zeae]
MNSISAVTDPVAPKVLEAHGSAGDQLDFDHVYFAQHVTAQVPHYTGMARGHTVRITWENPRHTYHSEVITVGTPGTIDIRIPRLEVIDSIGHTVKVFYTVRTAPGTTLIPSRYLLLHILPQSFDLLAPTLSSDQETVSVNYAGMTTGYTVRLRATANTLWESDTRPVQAGVTPVFTLPSDWRTNNRGADALINYTVYKSGSGERLMFSKVLRVLVGGAVPGPDLLENFDAYPDRSIAPGQSFDLASMKVTNLGRSGGLVKLTEAGATNIPGKIERKVLVTDGVISTLRLDLHSTYSRVRFWYQDVHVAATAVFYNAAGNSLGKKELTNYHPDNSPKQLDFSAHGIRRIDIQNATSDVVRYDNFELTN